MKEKDLLQKLLEICYASGNCEYSYNVSKEDVDNCILYLTAKIEGKVFNPYDKEQWEEVKFIL